MRHYDVLIAGGAVAGPVAAKFLAAAGLSVLLIEKDAVPRERGAEFRDRCLFKSLEERAGRGRSGSAHAVQFWNIEYNNMKLAGVYKTLGDGKDYWMAGTGYDRGIAARRGTAAIDEYAPLMTRLVAQTRANQAKGILAFSSNDEFLAHIRGSVVPAGTRMLAQMLFNRFRRAERQVMIP